MHFQLYVGSCPRSAEMIEEQLRRISDATVELYPSANRMNERGMTPVVPLLLVADGVKIEHYEDICDWLRDNHAERVLTKHRKQISGSQQFAHA